MCQGIASALLSSYDLASGIVSMNYGGAVVVVLVVVDEVDEVVGAGVVVVVVGGAVVVVLVVGGGVVVVLVEVVVVLEVVVVELVVVVVLVVVLVVLVVLLVVVEDVVVVGGGVVVVVLLVVVVVFFGFLPKKITVPLKTPGEPPAPGVKVPASSILDPAANGGPELLMLSICTFDFGRFAITVEVPSRLTFEPIPDIPHTQLR